MANDPVTTHTISGAMVLDGDEYLDQAMAIRGALGASLVDYASGLAVRSAGEVPSTDHGLAANGVAEVVRAILTSAALGGPGEPAWLGEVFICADNGYHLIRLVTARPDSQLVLYLWLDRQLGNLAMAQRQLRLATTEIGTPTGSVGTGRAS